ncbi:hypothetical protein C8J57DRAFT_214359 [Mycena rebaudengoi]|nr:hypothetical protein C8J57DRAFT_214359 [Mycena rebaudengoi]
MASELSFIRSRLQPLIVQERRPIVGTTEQLSTNPTKEEIETLMDTDSIILRPALSQDSHLYDITNVSTPTVSVASPRQTTVHFTSKADATFETQLENSQLQLRTLQGKVSSLEQAVDALKETVAGHNAQLKLDADWQVYSSAQHALDEIIFIKDEMKCRAQEIHSGTELRQAITDPRVAESKRSVAEMVYASAPSSYRQALLIVTTAKRTLDGARNSKAHLPSTVADLRRLLDSVDSEILNQVAESEEVVWTGKDKGQKRRRFVDGN